MCVFIMWTCTHRLTYWLKRNNDKIRSSKILPSFMCIYIKCYTNQFSSLSRRVLRFHLHFACYSNCTQARRACDKSIILSTNTFTCIWAENEREKSRTKTVFFTCVEQATFTFCEFVYIASTAAHTYHYVQRKKERVKRNNT